MNIISIPAFNDNYFWWIAPTNDKIGFVVDPGDSQVVEQFIAEHQYELQGILITHHHYDHIGGIKKLIEHRSIPVYGPLNETIEGVTHPLAEGDTVQIGELFLNVLDVPGHTAGHIAYHNQNILFPGDTLFLGGCGRLFEGTPEQMFDSLQKLKCLPEATKIYCAHEYTLNNLRFAQAVEPQNVDIQSRINKVTELRNADKPSVPDLLGEELKTNPFLRTQHQSIKEACEVYEGTRLNDEKSIFRVLRAWKDNF